MLGWLLTTPTSAQVEFAFVGEAPGPEDSKLNVIDGKGANGFTVRLYFDQQTNQLIGLSYKAKQTMRGFGRRGPGGPGGPGSQGGQAAPQAAPAGPAPAGPAPAGPAPAGPGGPGRVRVDSDLKARKPGNPDNLDRADSRDNARTHSRRARTLHERNPG